MFPRQWLAWFGEQMYSYTVYSGTVQTINDWQLFMGEKFWI